MTSGHARPWTGSRCESSPCLLPASNVRCREVWGRLSHEKDDEDSDAALLLAQRAARQARDEQQSLAQGSESSGQAGSSSERGDEGSEQDVQSSGQEGDTPEP